MMDLMKTLGSQRPPSVTAAEVVNNPEPAGLLSSGDAKDLTVAMRDLPHAPLFTHTMDIGVSCLGKDDNGGGIWKCESCTLDNPMSALTWWTWGGN